MAFHLRRLARRLARPVARASSGESDCVYWAYRFLLGREPDPGGLAHFRGLMDRGLSFDDLVSAFTESPEYQARQRAQQAQRARDDEPVAVDLGGYRVFVRKTELDFGRGIFYSGGRYEEHVRAQVRAHVRPGDTVLDIGANVGVIALLAATLVGPSGRVIAVEPNPDNLQLLFRGILAGRFRQVSVLPFAASDAEAIVHLTGGTSNTHVECGAAPDAAGYFVQARTLDEAIGERLDRLDFVKADIEGHEPMALRGARRLLERFRPTLLTEFNPRCLRELQSVEPIDYLRQLFALYPRLLATSAFGDEHVFSDAERLMAFWETRNREVVAAGALPEGMLHFDLVSQR